MKKLLPFLGLLSILSVGTARARTWTESATGKKIEADWVSADAGSVTVSIRGGRTFTIALDRLSPEDQAFVKQQLAAPPAAAPAGKAAAAEDRFDDLGSLTLEKIPATGEGLPELAGVDEAIRRFMVEKGVGAVTFALSKGGKLLHDRAFGWAEADLKTPLQPGVRMRVASMTKPVVQAAVKTLITEGKLKAEDGVFSTLGLDRHPEAKGCDERWQRVTIQHLLEHKGGWDRDLSGDFTFNDDIADTFKVKIDELTPEHVVRYGLRQKFDFEPGERYAYCNYGYILLARVVEKLSGQAFFEYLGSTVCKQAGITSFSLSRSDARDRQPGEVWYTYHPEYPRRTVPLPFRTEARDGAGVLACTAADYCRFLEHYSVLGNLRRAGGRYRGSFSGSHPGVTAICSQREDGINYAVICNRRGQGSADWNAELRKAVDAELEKVAAQLK